MKVILKQNGGWLEKREILRHHWFELDMAIFSSIVEKLSMANMIETGYSNGNEPVYRATTYAIEKFLMKN